MKKIKMPEGYYINQIIEGFSDNSNIIVDYNTDIYNRNKQLMVN